MAKKILVCDRCGAELTDEMDIEMALEGQNAWTTSARNRGTQAGVSYLAGTLSAAVAK